MIEDFVIKNELKYLFFKNKRKYFKCLFIKGKCNIIHDRHISGSIWKLKEITFSMFAYEINYIFYSTI